MCTMHTGGPTWALWVPALGPLAALVGITGKKVAATLVTMQFCLFTLSKLGGKGRAWLFLYAAAAARFASASGTSQLLVPAGRQWAHIAGQRTQNQKDGPVFCLSVCCWKHACLSYFLQFIIEIGVVVIEAVKSVNEADWQGFDIFFIFSCDIVQV